MNIFLTGGSGGIGRELIRIFAEDTNNRIYYTYCHHKPEETAHGSVKALRCDLDSQAEIQRLVSELNDVDFDVIINNAFPKLEIQSFYKTEWTCVENSMNVGVRAAFELTKAFSRAMKKKKKGYVINILSSSVLGASPEQMMPYVIAKYALLGFHNALASELSKSGIKIFAVSPHMVKTDFLSKLPDHYVAMTAETLPGKKLLDPLQVAEKVKVLVSGGIEDVSGANIPILEGALRS